MKRISMIILMIYLFGMVVSCTSKTERGNGKIVTTTRQVASFDNVVVGGKFQLTVVADKSQLVQVKTDSNLQQFVLTQVKDDTLRIAVKNGYQLTSQYPIKVTVSMSRIKKLTTRGESQSDVRGISGDDFVLNSNGKSHIVLAGSVSNSAYKLSGKSQLDARNLLAKQVNLNVTGNATGYIYVMRKLDVSINGKGQVKYFGEPPIINQKIFGGGKLIKAGAVSSQPVLINTPAVPNTTSKN